VDINIGKGRRAQYLGGSSRLIEVTHDLVDITPSPNRGRYCTHDRMLCLPEVSGRVFLGRGIAAADVAAGFALP